MRKEIENDAIILRYQNLMKRIHQAEQQLVSIEHIMNDPIRRIKNELIQNHIYTANFHEVDDNYYDLSLKERAILLKCNVEQLCKSIIFENTAYEADDTNNLYKTSNDYTNSKYYCVITQYICKQISY